MTLSSSFGSFEEVLPASSLDLEPLGFLGNWERREVRTPLVIDKDIIIIVTITEHLPCVRHLRIISYFILPQAFEGKYRDSFTNEEAKV